MLAHAVGDVDSERFGSCPSDQGEFLGLGKNLKEKAGARASSHTCNSFTYKYQDSSGHPGWRPGGRTVLGAQNWKKTKNSGSKGDGWTKDDL